MSDTEIVTLGPLRHVCHTSGACCFSRVPVQEDEVARIEGHARSLGVEQPIVDGALRNDEDRGGPCVFLGDDRLCRIHKEFGMEEKPLACQLFPVKRVRTESEERAAIDPSCVTSHQSWLDGAVQDPDVPLVQDSRLSQHDVRAESMLIALSRKPGSTVATLLTVLSGAHPRPMVKRLPRGFGTRLLVRAEALRLRQFLDHPEVGDALKTRLEHLVPFIDDADPESPPSWPVLTREQEEFALSVMRRTLFLRFAPLSPATQGLALLLLSGAVLLAWADPDEETFGEGMSAWSRLVRYRALWLRFFPDPEILIWLATGRAPKGDPGQVAEAPAPKRDYSSLE